MPWVHLGCFTLLWISLFYLCEKIFKLRWNGGEIFHFWERQNCGKLQKNIKLEIVFYSQTPIKQAKGVRNQTKGRKFTLFVVQATLVTAARSCDIIYRSESSKWVENRQLLVYSIGKVSEAHRSSIILQVTPNGL